MGTATAALPAGEIQRPRLSLRLDEATTAGRLTVLVAGAGFGKTTMLRHWTVDGPTAWHSVRPVDRDPGTLARHLVDALRLRVPELSAASMAAASRLHGYADDESAGAVAIASAIAESLDATMRRPTVLIVDDLHELGAAAGSAALMDALIRNAPTLLSIVVASRDQPPFPTARLVAHGEAIEIAAAELAFTPDESAELLRATAGVDGDGVRRVHTVTAGWPVATRLAAVALASGPGESDALLAEVDDPRGLLLRYMTDEVIEREDEDVLEFLDCMQVLDAVDAGLAKAVGLVDPEPLLDRLVRQGVYVEPVPGARGRVMLRPLFRSYLAHHRRLPNERRVEAMTAAAQWHLGQGETASALTYAVRLADAVMCASLLRDHGPGLAAAGHAREVLDAAALVPDERRDPATDVLVGDAALMLGQWDAALGHYRKAATGELVPAAAAWRMGFLHYLRGELTDALAVFAAADDADPDPAARALLLGWWASAHWLRGDRDRCRELVTRAEEAARASADSRALACVHTVLAMLAAVEGDRAGNDAHYLSALDHATAAGDVMQLVRIHANRSSQRLEEGDAEGALVEVDHALRLADLAGLAAFRALAMSNRGEALLALGRLDEARTELASALAVFDSLGSSMAAYPCSALGDVHALRGDRVGARAAYERAIGLSEAVGDTQGLVPALAGLAELCLRDDPERARQLISRALAAGTSLGFVRASLSAARIHAAHGETAEARAHVHRAAAAAGEQRDRAGLAEASEVTAEVNDDRAAALAAIEQWDEIGDPVRSARARLVLARLEPPVRRFAEAVRVEREARRLGAREIAQSAQELLGADGSGSELEGVRLTCLGGMSVSLAGEVLPASAWQSRKARDLLKILVCRQGRPIHREELLELLWPGEDVAKTGNRLSVALSTVRSVLDPDRRHPSDHHVQSQGDAISLHHVTVDVERFLDDAARGLALLRGGDATAAAGLLEAAELSYAGDLFDEDPYAEWAVDLREKARLVYLEVTRKLADLAGDSGDGEARSRYLLRILERDPYDESAHLDLVRLLAAQGKHGEARRRYRLYARRLAEIDVEAAAYPVSGRGSAPRSGGSRSASEG